MHVLTLLIGTLLAATTPGAAPHAPAAPSAAPPGARYLVGVEGMH